MTTQTAARAAHRVTTRPARLDRWRSSPWLWLIPLTALLVLVFLYPLVEIVRLSFTDASLVSGEGYSYGLDPYRSILRGRDFLGVLRVTFLFVLFSVVFQMLLGFGIALLLDTAQRRGLRFTVLTRTVVMTAWAIPGVIIGIIWSFLYQETESGILNYLGSLVGLSGNIAFLSDPHTALTSVTVANIWRGTALSMIFCYAGLKTVPRDLVEASRVDGAGPWQFLTRVTLPMLLPLLTINLIVVTVETFNTFDMVLALTGGGPGAATEVLALGVYDQVFRLLNLGRGAAMAVVLMVINLAMILVYLRYAERQERNA